MILLKSTETGLGDLKARQQAWEIWLPLTSMTRSESPPGAGGRAGKLLRRLCASRSVASFGSDTSRVPATPAAAGVPTTMGIYLLTAWTAQVLPNDGMTCWQHNAAFQKRV